MQKKILAVTMASIMLLLVACNKPGTPTPNEKFPFDETKTGVEFHTEPLEDAIYSMMLEPVSHSIPKDSFLVSVIDGSDSEWIGDDDWNSVYNIFQIEDNTEYARLTLTTTPPDLKGHFGVSSDTDVLNELKAKIFTTQNVHDGLLTGARDDFGYKILTDVSGSVLGYNAFFIEFLNEETNNHAMRFYLSNDEINEKHVSLTMNANIPADKTELIEAYRKMFFSLTKANP